MSCLTALCHGDFGRVGIYQLDRAIAKHAHREGHLKFWIGGEQPTISVEDNRFKLCGRNLIAVNPWVPHTYEHVASVGISWMLIIYIDPSWLGEGQQIDAAHLQFGATSLPKTQQVNNVVKQLTAALTAGESASTIGSYVLDLTQRCICESWQQTSSSTIPQAFVRSNDFRIRRSLRLIDKQPATELNLGTVARESGLSRPHFFKLFKQHMGITPNIYLNTVRVERALVEMVSGQAPIGQIADDLGFSSQSSFSHFFSRNVGVSPSDYRRAVQELNSGTNREAT